MLMTADDVLADLGDAPFEVVRAERVVRQVPQAGRVDRARRTTPWCAAGTGADVESHA